MLLEHQNKRRLIQAELDRRHSPNADSGYRNSALKNAAVSLQSGNSFEKPPNASSNITTYASGDQRHGKNLIGRLPHTAMPQNTGILPENFIINRYNI